jgi:CelD/BcsL family acetyltransferase involved in cellulose biosynthesis
VPIVAPVTLDVRTLSTAAELSALEPEWRALHERAGTDLPFAAPEWSSCWWQHLRARGLTARDSLCARAVRDGRGELVAVAPLMITERPAVGPLRARCLRFLRADPNITELSGMLCKPGLEAEATAAVLADVRASGSQWDWMQWSGVLIGGPEDRVLAGETAHTASVIPSYLLTLPPTWDEFRAGLKRNIKESLRKCYNSPRRAGLQTSLHVADSRAEVLESLEQFFRLHAQRAGKADGVLHANVFATVASREFLRDVCGRLADRGAVRAFVLRVSGKTAAIRLGFTFGRRLYLYYSGYDPAYAEHSVMTTCVAEAIRWAIGEGCSTVNLSTGNDVSKTRWGPRELEHREAILLSPKPRGALAFRAVNAIKQALAAVTSRPGTARPPSSSTPAA